MYRNDYSPQMVQGEMAVWVQSTGWVKARQGKDLKIGDQIVYNWGYIGTIVSIIKETHKTITFGIESSGKVYEQRIGKETWKPVAN